MIIIIFQGVLVLDNLSNNPYVIKNECNDEIHFKEKRIYAIFKRLFDFFASLIAIIVFSWLLLILAILVKVTSKGPIIYSSTRVGKNGKEFKMYKFRSMRVGADLEKADLMKYNEIEGGITFKMENDPRVTKFGKFIRKTSLDELPQLFNILFGDMSIIGPRAALPEEGAKYDDRAKLRLLVQQGLSGEWQANGRSNTSFNEMIDMDLDYVFNKRGFFYDIQLIFKTVYVVLKRDGAK